MTTHSNKAGAEGNLKIPPLALALLNKISQTIRTDNVCIAVGFLRGLYMQQMLGLNPQMNDIDIFADISVEDFADVREALQKELGIPVRYHVGRFEDEENPRGLIEFALPSDLIRVCGGVKSVQLNFGLPHPWADASKYIELANIGINQISLDQRGQVFMSDMFVLDMQIQTMTMNPYRNWSQHDWDRTEKSMTRMLKERPEFRGWHIIVGNKPVKPTAGSFWSSCRGLNPSNGWGRY